MRKVTEQALKNVGMKGKYLVVELTEDHHQDGCLTVPAGTRGVIKASSPPVLFFVFPHTVLNEKIKAFSDGDVRIIDTKKWKAVGRID